MGQSIKAYIIADNRNVCETLSKILEEFGIDPIGFEINVSDAIHKLQKMDADIVLIDVDSKRTIEDLHFATKIKKVLQIPFIFISNLNDNKSLQELIEIEPYAVVSRPFNTTDLYAAIVICLERFASIGKTDIGHNENTLDESHQEFSLEDKVFVEKDGKLFRLKIGEILFVQINDNSAELTLSSNQKIPLDDSLKFITRLPIKDFIKVHNQFIINTNEITEFGNDYIQVHDYKIPLLEEYKELLLSRIIKL